MNFNEFKDFIKSIDVPVQRMGIFDLDITYKGKQYLFTSLKENASFNDDLMGFGLNHHFGNIRELPTKSSIFHDSEDVSVDIWRNEVVEITKESDTKVVIKTKKWTGILKIN